MSITHEELVERIGKAMLEMEGEDLANLYNQHFGDGMRYIGDSQYEQAEVIIVNEVDDTIDSNMSALLDVVQLPASLWLRIGDGSSYEAFGDDLNAVIDSLTEAGVGPVTRWRDGGFETEGYSSANYISLYYGDKASNYSHNLDASERRKVELALKN